MVTGVLFQGAPVRFVRIASVLLLVLCLIDVVQDCATSASLNLPDDDDHQHCALALSVAIVFGGSYALIHPSRAHLAPPSALQSVYHPLRQ